MEPVWQRWLSKSSPRRRRMLRLALAPAAAGGAVLSGVIVFALCAFPGRELTRYRACTHLVDRDGATLRVILPGNDTHCHPVPLRATGQWAARALVASEDKRFRRHVGIDPVAVARAALQNARAMRRISGASTISTQTIRLVTPRSRTLLTKLVEAAQAVRLERRLSKDGILEQYLNRVPLGGNLTGIESASRRYFGKNAVDLTLGEAALMMGLVQAPTRFRPDRYPARAVKRRAYVLERMAALGFIDAKARHTVEQEVLDIRCRTLPFEAPHFCDFVRRTRVDPSAETQGREPSPSIVRTTLDSELQRIVAEETRRHAQTMRPAGVHGAAIVLLEVTSGAVRAMVGSPGYDDADHAGQVNGALALRSPGSALKPFAYAWAMDRGLCTPATVLTDVPVTFRDYTPRNFGQGYSGLIPAPQGHGRPRRRSRQHCRQPAHPAPRAGRPLPPGATPARVHPTHRPASRGRHARTFLVRERPLRGSVHSVRPPLLATPTRPAPDHLL